MGTLLITFYWKALGLMTRLKQGLDLAVSQKDGASDLS